MTEQIEMIDMHGLDNFFNEPGHDIRVRIQRINPAHNRADAGAVDNINFNPGFGERADCADMRVASGTAAAQA